MHPDTNARPWRIDLQQWLDYTWGFWIVAPNMVTVAKSTRKYTTRRGAEQAAVRMMGAWQTNGIEVRR